MTTDLKRRLRNQGYTISDCCEFEYYDNIDVGANREKELNIKFGYPWQDTQDYRVATQRGKLGSIEAQKNPNWGNGELTAKVRKERGDKFFSKETCRSGGLASSTTGLTEEMVIYIRQQYATGKYKQVRIAKVFGLKKANLNAILKRRSWTHI